MKYEDGIRYWVIENHEYDFVPDEYVGLVDEDAGGIVAFGSYQNITALAKRLNAMEGTS